MAKQNFSLVLADFELIHFLGLKCVILKLIPTEETKVSEGPGPESEVHLFYSSRAYELVIKFNVCY